MFVMPAPLATSSDYTTWTSGAAPANIAAVLRECTTLVLDATDGVIYDVDPLTGLATDAVVRQALMNATCIQAAAWVKLGIDPAAGGVFLGGAKKSAKIGTASYELAGSDAASTAKQAAVEALVPSAQRYLSQRNLLATEPYMAG